MAATLHARQASNFKKIPAESAVAMERVVPRKDTAETGPVMLPSRKIALIAFWIADFAVCVIFFC